MMFNGLRFSPLLLVCSLNSVFATHICYNLKPVPDFDINKFLGIWYTVETSVRSSRCLVNEFSHALRYTNESGKETGTPRDDDDPTVYMHYFVGELMFNNSDLLSAMTPFALPVDPFRASYVVFATDYVNYAGVYYCETDTTGRKHTITIMSRTETLDELTVKKVKKTIHSSGYNMGMLKKVDHSGCKHRYLKFNDNKIYYYVNFQTNEVLTEEQLPKWML